MLKNDKNASVNFDFCTEQGHIFNKDMLILKIIPFCSRKIIKNIFCNKNNKTVKSSNDIKLYSNQNFILSIFNRYNFLLYNGRVFTKFKFSNLRVYQRFGAFLTTRVLNSGRVLHLRKKTNKKKK